jgi:hypothetical protein
MRWEVLLLVLLKVAPGGAIVVPMALSLLLLEKVTKGVEKVGENPVRQFQAPTLVAETPGALPTKLVRVPILVLVIAGEQRMLQFQAGSCSCNSPTRLSLRPIQKG